MAEHSPMSPGGDDDRDPLEAELRLFRPVPPLSDLRRRVSERLSGAPAGARVRDWPLTAGLAAAACLAIAMMLWRAGGGAGDTPHVATVPPPTMPSTRPAPAPDVPMPLPTRMAYHRALAESPEALEALLDRRPAGAPRRTGRKAAPVRAFTRSTIDLVGPTGDSL